MALEKVCRTFNPTERKGIDEDNTASFGIQCLGGSGLPKKLSTPSSCKSLARRVALPFTAAVTVNDCAGSPISFDDKFMCSGTSGNTGSFNNALTRDEALPLEVVYALRGATTSAGLIADEWLYELQNNRNDALCVDNRNNALGSFQRAGVTAAVSYRSNLKYDAALRSARTNLESVIAKVSDALRSVDSTKEVNQCELLSSFVEHAAKLAQSEGKCASSIADALDTCGVLIIV